MKIEVDIGQHEKEEIIRHTLVDEYKLMMNMSETFYTTISKETLLDSLKNLIYWYSPEYLYKEFLESIGEK